MSGLNVKSLFQALFPCRYETRCFKSTIFSNFPRVDFDTFFIWCSSVPADEKSAKKPLVTISSGLIQYNVWTIAWILALYEIVLLMTKQTNLPPNLHITLDALPCTCSTYNIHRGVLGTTVNPETCWIRVEGRIRFVYAMCGRDFFKIRNKKYPDSKISGYVWTGPKVAEYNHCTWECNHLATFPPSSLKRERENPSLFAFSIFCLNVWCFLKFFAPLSLIRHVYNNPERRKRAMIVCFLKTILQGAYAGQHCWGSMQTSATLLRYASPVADLLGQKFDRFQTVRNLCQHCCGSMQTDATSHNIVGPNTVECCWPTMLRPFAWAFRVRIISIFMQL